MLAEVEGTCRWGKHFGKQTTVGKRGEVAAGGEQEVGVGAGTGNFGFKVLEQHIFNVS